MHQNRIEYSLPEYQNKLRNGYKKLGILCTHKDRKISQVFRPVPKTPWLPEARNKYYGRLIARSKALVKQKKYSFCTLTYDMKLYSKVEVSQRLKHDIDLFFKRLGYRKSKPEYFYVIELTDNFYPHVHLIFDRFVHKRKIFMSWYKVTGSTAVKIQSLSYTKALYYCLKYLTRAKKQSEAKFGFLFSYVDRLWTCSRKFFSKLPPRAKEWVFNCLFNDQFVETFEVMFHPDTDLKSYEFERSDFEKLLAKLIFDDNIITYGTLYGGYDD